MLLPDFATISNISYIEELYRSYLADPKSVDSSWRYFFEGMQLASRIPSGSKESPDLRVHLLIEAYRSYGHLLARINPLYPAPAHEPDELNPQKLGFSQQELEEEFPTCGFLDKPQTPLKVLIEALKMTYAGTIGIEYMGLGTPHIEAWLQTRIEPFFPLHLTSEERIWILELLNKAELLEVFLHTKYVGQKRFSLEGGETLIPMIAAILEKGADLQVAEATIGMAHRGRLNVLANILNKSYAQIFREFEAHYTPQEFEGTGDVKYHKGFVGKLQTRSGKEIAVTIVANPSHLEAVNPVVEGIVRAQQEKRGNRTSLPILIHGDASVAGQGVIYETLQLCNLKGYATGGTLHIVVNNQIGFTTLPKDGRSTRYCTDIAKAFGAPVFHVNAEDPQSCIRVAQLAIEMRQQFQCDVFIDLNCYRKYGHNESDEPTFTQPLEYAIIKNKRSIHQMYKEKLIQENILDAKRSEEMESAFKESLHRALEPATAATVPASASDADIPREPSPSSIRTGVSTQKLIALAEKFCIIPPSLKIHPKVAHGVQGRLQMVRANPQEAHIDWGMGEHLAYASLLTEKIHVRISGQDVRRGTFSHRHAIWVDQVKEERYFPLSHLSQDQAPFDIFNSPLSEYAVLGFDYGYSVAYPHSLVIWEAQFGDFGNGAQIIIDQFIASSEQKWNLLSNITLFLPHGYEGQGPEHSSARIERFLQLCGQENMRIANCTTPAQLFHLLRSQALSSIKKPLILFTHKALLRHPGCVSSLSDFAEDVFHEIFEDKNAASPTRLYLCSGKIYFDLLEHRQKVNASSIALVRVEQLFPFPAKALSALFAKFPECAVYWVQEEHSNMGAWEYIRPLIDELLGAKRRVEYIGRDRSASPAAGSYTLHKKQWKNILDRAFGESG
ncbi:MAG TPA: 2-oxoglutarate dehydrogenase E1 component [Rhabdochlamydiaceae bacterium]|jgi:2-oxoglutarate dehydrogenase E1 component